MDKPTVPETASQLALPIRLTTKAQQLCLGLESGAADLLELVTPTTAELLHWWFGQDMVDARAGLNFHAGQKQAILNAIVAHEVLGAATLKDLYAQVAPDALLAGQRLAEVSAGKHAHPKYCFKMATGTGKTWVLQALLIWQLLNKNAALAEGLDDARFTRFFLVVAPGLIVYERLLDAFCGKPVENGNGMRDFATSDVAQFADLFIPEAHRWPRTRWWPPCCRSCRPRHRQPPGRARQALCAGQCAGVSGRLARADGVQRRGAPYP